VKLRSLHLFCGLGGDLLGFVRAGYSATGIDADPLACRGARTLTGSPIHQADLSTLCPAELVALHPAPPHVVVLSPPCQGNSGCLPPIKASLPHYQQLNELASRTVMLVCEAALLWGTRPVILVENVPRITSRSPAVVEAIGKILGAYGYLHDQGTHDCGAISCGEVPQVRQRWLLIARHPRACPAWITRPKTSKVAPVGSIFADLAPPIPGTAAGSGLHEMPKLAAKTWLRLALIPPGKDWRALPSRVLVGGHPQDPTLAFGPLAQSGRAGVQGEASASHTVTATARNWCAVQDPRLAHPSRNGNLLVEAPQDPANTVIAASRVYHGQSVADPRIAHTTTHTGGWGVLGQEQPSRTIRASAISQTTPIHVADPRLGCTPRSSTYGIQDPDSPSATVLASADVACGAFALGDPRPLWIPTHELRVEDGETICAPLLDHVPLDLDDPTPCTGIVIRALDQTFHRPLTDLELARIQGFPVLIDGQPLTLPGSREQRRRLIGNAIPPPSAYRIALRVREALLASGLAGLLVPSDEAIWVEEAGP